MELGGGDFLIIFRGVCRPYHLQAYVVNRSLFIYCSPAWCSSRELCTCCKLSPSLRSSKYMDRPEQHFDEGKPACVRQGEGYFRNGSSLVID